MLVKDLIRDSIWLPGSGYGKKPAKLCITLPTYRRLACGLFERCVDSVLAQSFTDFELIIVDDGSTDGTFDRIKEYMKADGRVSCIRHPRNVGLPAVSSYESYRRATADYFGHAFDDCTFEPDAFSLLLRAAEERGAKAVVGYGSTVNAAGHMVNIGYNISPRALADLRICNFLLHHCLLLHRDIFETIGHYDPHVSLIRLCDWDLLRRIRERAALACVDVYVGYEGGGVAEGTLARTFELDMLTVFARMDSERTEQLSTEALMDYDVFSLPEGLSREALDAYAGHMRRDYGQRFWYTPVIQEGYAFNEKGAGLHITPIGAAPSTYTPFDGLGKDAPGFFHTHPAEYAVRPEMMLASGYVALSHALGGMELLKIAQVAHGCGIPAYYLDADESIMKMLAADAPKALCDTLAIFSGMIVPSRERADFYADKGLHPNILILPPVYRADLVEGPARESASANELRIALPEHAESDAFLQKVYPALRRLSEETRLSLLCPASLAERIGKFLKHTEVTSFDEPADYPAYVRTLAAFSPDALLDVPPSSQAGLCRSPLALMSASLAGAILVTEQAPLSGDNFAWLAYVAEASPQGWQETLRRVLHSPEERSAKARAAAVWCRKNFGAERNIRTLRELAEKHPAPGAFEMRMRMRGLLRLR